jgi:GWxTD domain-containing protein
MIIGTALLFSILSCLSAEPCKGGQCDLNALAERLTPAERETCCSLQYLMNRFQTRQYLSLETESERNEWIEAFWLDLDPTPTTELNERRDEHERRTALARKLFGKTEEPGWDARGEMLIRFGTPSLRQPTPMDITFHYMTPAGEFWYYEPLNMTIMFHDLTLSGNYTIAIPRMSPTGRMLMAQRRGLVINPNEIDYIADPLIVREMPPRDLLAEIDREKMEESHNNFYKYMKEKSYIHSCELESAVLPAVFDVSAFRGGPGKARTEISIEVPSSELSFEQSGEWQRAELELRVIARDIDLKKAAFGEDVFKVTRRRLREQGGEYLVPGLVSLTLKPGYYRLGIEVIDRFSGRRGAMKTNLVLPSLDGGLRLSDVQFASSIRETEENGAFVKGNLMVVPHPLHTYRIPSPLKFYFEIYGLDTDREGKAFYSVEYRITPLEKRRSGPVLKDMKTAISSSFNTTGYGAMQAHRLEIATANLWKSRFRLTVAVTDRRTLSTVEKTAEFKVID